MATVWTWTAHGEEQLNRKKAQVIWYCEGTSVTESPWRTIRPSAKLWTRSRSRCHMRGLIPGSYLYRTVTAVARGIQGGLAYCRRKICGMVTYGIAVSSTSTNHQKTVVGKNPDHNEPASARAQPSRTQWFLWPLREAGKKHAGHHSSRIKLGVLLSSLLLPNCRRGLATTYPRYSHRRRCAWNLIGNVVRER